MSTVINSARRRLLKAKFLIPIAVILWLLVAVPLALFTSSAEARPSSNGRQDANCNQEPFKSLNFNSRTWNHGIDSGTVWKFQLIDPCHTTTASLKLAEDYIGDGDLDQYALSNESMYVNNTNYAQALQKYGECYAGTDRACNMIGEISRQDQSAGMHPYCKDWDASYGWYPGEDAFIWTQDGYPMKDYYGNIVGPNGATVPPNPGRACEANYRDSNGNQQTQQNYQVVLEGAQVLDNKSGHTGIWAEIHPTIRETYKSSDDSTVLNQITGFKRK